MSNAVKVREQVVRWRMAGIAVLLGATLSVSAGAQQTTSTSPGQRTTPCPAPQANGATPSASAGVSGVTSATSNGAVATDAAAATTAAGTTTASNGTPTGAGSTAGVAATPAPNNTSTNPDQRFTGLNATNGGAGVGADTTTTGKRVPPVAEQVPSDSVRAGATVCAPTTGH